ncbi:hypothetical protein G7Z17_g4320 [Cylindrodendrum hubeiense]|uniref:Uncharacterized protein n=1 Tax=Cylindrodendrum hubeiense TaxID=595255 RepID=A0A9P5HH43_9HYPO|nr:hypothetical protein G7Z17_g4320 [Cylindrodendrum hubeiense]
MKPKSPKPQTLRSRLTPESLEVIRAKEAEAVRCILPEAKNDPDLYQRVVNKLHETGVGECHNWSDYRFSRWFYSWVSMQDKDERPPLEYLLTLLAAHQCLSHRHNDQFNQEVRRRGLIQWATEKLKPPQTESEMSSPGVVKKEKRNGNSSPDSLGRTPVASRSQKSRETVLPSIEQHSKRPDQQSATVRSFQASPRAPLFHQDPSHKRKATPHFEREDGARGTKIYKPHYVAHQAKVSTRDAATQTDDYTPEIAGKVVDIIKHTFGEGLARQTQSLTDFLPAVVRQAFQQDVADEVARQQPSSALQSLAMRPTETDVTLARPTYMTYMTPIRAPSQAYEVVDYQREDVHTVGGRGGGRGLTAIVTADLDRLEAYRFTRGSNQRRL